MKRLLPGLLALSLVACATAPPTPPAADPERAWRIHSTALENLERWQLTGRLGIVTEEEGWHARLDWKQEADRYRIRITGPLGQGSVQLEGTPKQVLLRTADAETVAADPERLLWQELGWRVPVSFLRYWVLGLPAPDAPAQRQLNAEGRLERLQQSGWEISFLDYRESNGMVLPGKVFAHNQQARVRLVVGDWDLPRLSVEPSPR